MIGYARKRSEVSMMIWLLYGTQMQNVDVNVEPCALGSIHLCPLGCVLLLLFATVYIHNKLSEISSAPMV
jgi:hypothetical protein